MKRLLCLMGLHFWMYYTTHNAIYRACKNCKCEYVSKDWHTVWHYLEKDSFYYINPETIIKGGF